MKKTQKIAEPQFQSATVRTGDQLSTLIHKIGHEIGNPLTAIISLAAVLERAEGSTTSAAEGDSKVAEYSRSIAHEAWRISRLNEQLVLLLSDRQSLLDECDLVRLLNSAVRKIRVRFPELAHQVSTEIKTERETPPVLIDSDQVLSLVQELLLNAWQAAAASSNPIVSITITSEQDSAVATIENEIAETSSVDIETLFEPFVTGQPHARTLGLGLTVVTSIAERSDVKVQLCEVSEDSPARFMTRICFPYVPEETTGDTSTSAKATPPWSDVMEGLPPKVDVLIVEDEQTVASAMEKILKLAFSEKTTFSCKVVTPNELLERIEKGAPISAILCDLNLGAISGKQIFEAICAKWPERKSTFAFLTGERLRTDTQNFLENSGCEFLHKPFEPEQLVDLVLRLVSQ